MQYVGVVYNSQLYLLGTLVILGMENESISQEDIS